MIQKPIREWNGTPYTNAEADELTQELNDRTAYGVDGYNSISDIGAKTESIKGKTDNITVTNPVDLDQLSIDVSTNTAKRSYPIGDENRLASTSGTNTGDQDLSSYDTHLSNTSNPHGVTASQIGLGSVDNTSDADKPISTAAAAKNSSQDSSISANTAITNVSIVSDTTSAGGGTSITNMVEITQAAYDAITPDVNTYYLING